jgi:hypothetical protein
MTFTGFAAGAILYCAMFAGTAAAATFSYVFSGVAGGGTLNGVAFPTGRFGISGTADTASIVKNAALFTVALQDVVVQAKFGTVTLTSPVNLFADNDLAIVGLSRGDGGGVHLIEAPMPDSIIYELNALADFPNTIALFMNWDASFGSVTSTGGPLVFDKGASITTFQAGPVLQVSPIPLPAGGLMLTAAVAALAALRRRAAAAAR